MQHKFITLILFFTLLQTKITSTSNIEISPQTPTLNTTTRPPSPLFQILETLDKESSNNDENNNSLLSINSNPNLDELSILPDLSIDIEQLKHFPKEHTSPVHQKSFEQEFTFDIHKINLHDEHSRQPLRLDDTFKKFQIKNTTTENVSKEKIQQLAELQKVKSRLQRITQITDKEKKDIADWKNLLLPHETIKSIMTILWTAKHTKNFAQQNPNTPHETVLVYLQIVETIGREKYQKNLDEFLEK